MTTRRSKSEWQRLIDEQAVSGLTQKAFCEQAGIPLATFGYWKRKLRAEALSTSLRSEARTDTVSLEDWIELPNGLPEETPSWQIELDLGHGICLRLNRRQKLAESPTGGQLFVFINRKRTQMKGLYFEQGGYCLWSKRLEQGRFHFNAKGADKQARRWRLHKPRSPPSNSNSKVQTPAVRAQVREAEHRQPGPARSERPAGRHPCPC